MRGNSFGKLISMTTFGESHGEALGVVLDGIPAGLKVNIDDLQKELDRRAPGKTKGTTARKEPDKAEILSGVFEGHTLGTPIAVIVRNTNQRSKDYDAIKDDYRPGHADKTYMQKYGRRDHRGGGRSSGRETLARVIAGHFSSLIIPNIKVTGFITKMGPFEIEDPLLIDVNQDFSPYHFPILSKNSEIEKYLLDLKKSGNSVGGRISIIVDGAPAGLGEPAFDKLKADIAKALMSIGAVTSFEYGLGSKMAELSGEEVSKNRAHFGGIEGGISNGDRMYFSITFKPTSTIGEKAKQGRHDPCIVPRAVPVAEAMVKFIIADHYLRQNAYQNIE
ncbi:MAG: chorismate synthase [Halobacteriovoraceae bacterium]|nr:chorismate synthase [Halobacteriovoraceae bacterium]